MFSLPRASRSTFTQLVRDLSARRAPVSSHVRVCLARRTRRLVCAVAFYAGLRSVSVILFMRDLRVPDYDF